MWYTVVLWYQRLWPQTGFPFIRGSDPHSERVFTYILCISSHAYRLCQWKYCIIIYSIVRENQEESMNSCSIPAGWVCRCRTCGFSLLFGELVTRAAILKGDCKKISEPVTRALGFHHNSVEHDRCPGIQTQWIPSFYQLYLSCTLNVGPPWCKEKGHMNMNPLVLLQYVQICVCALYIYMFIYKHIYVCITYLYINTHIYVYIKTYVCITYL